MAENDTLPLPGIYRSEREHGAFDDEAVCYLETVATVSTAR